MEKLKEEINDVLKVFQNKRFKELLFKYLGALCLEFNINIDEVGRDVEKVIARSEMDDEMVMCDFRIIITKMFYKRKDDASYSQVKADIYDVMRKLSKPEKASFAHKLVGGHCYCVLLYLVDEYEKEQLALK
ncbi:TPA: hypothetical protein QCV86_006185 [Bacillus thuringiensis]|nr:hypothetical protein [Bacillus thuringiensis]HDR6835716.1 hypothetical protein [Bacillus thuringiensis]HDR6861244.1 hypothetical protein [Bacillus thuringiensis]HDR6906177.1 hypothetical protein [Bacillus thuringiensis]HDR6912726.1 hypothetical protein [Bacillus thuringiensis]